MAGRTQTRTASRGEQAEDVLSVVTFGILSASGALP